MRRADPGLLAACALVLAWGCGEGRPSDEEDGGGPADGGSGGTVDAGPADGGAPGADAGPGPGVDAGPARPALRLLSDPASPRRGPIALRFEVLGDDAHAAALRLEVRPGAAWAAATTLAAERAGTNALFVWDSFADVPADTAAALRLVAADALGDVELPFAQEVRNAPDADRLLLVGRPLRPVAGGGADHSGTGLTAVRWRGASPAAAGSRDLTVGRGPGLVRAAPHGRATAVREDADGTVALVATPLDAALAGVHVAATLDIDGDPGALAWTPDGRHLLVAAGHPQSGAPTLWRYEPADDFSSAAASALATLRGPPFGLEVDRRTGRILVACGGGGGSNPSTLVLLAPDGTELAHAADTQADEWGVFNALRLDPTGTRAIFTASMFGDEVRVFSVGAASVAQTAHLTTVRAPTDVVFHPGSDATAASALISDLERNTVTPLVLRAGQAPSVKAPVAGVPLAAEMDVVERGPQAGTVFVVGVTKLYRVTLAKDGTAGAATVAADFGAGTTAIAEGVAVQR